MSTGSTDISSFFALCKSLRCVTTEILRKSWSKIVDWPVNQKTCCSQHYRTSQSTNLLGQQWWWSCSLHKQNLDSLDSVNSSYESLKRGWKCSSQVTDSHSVDVETLRRKSVESPARWECLSSCWSNLLNAIIFSEKENCKTNFVSPDLPRAEAQCHRHHQ